MFVLRRKPGESFVIDSIITVTVLKIEGKRVKIGITAPPDVTIIREELLLVPPPTPAAVPLEEIHQ